MVNKKFRRRLWAEMDELGISVVAMLDLYGALAVLLHDMDEFQAIASRLDDTQTYRNPTDVTASKLAEAYRSSIVYFLQAFLPLWDDDADDESDFVHPETTGHLEGIRAEAKAQILSFAQDLELETGQQKDIHIEDLWAAISLAELVPYTEMDEEYEVDEMDEVDELTDEIARKLRGDGP